MYCIYDFHTNESTIRGIRLICEYDRIYHACTKRCLTNNLSKSKLGLWVAGDYWQACALSSMSSDEGAPYTPARGMSNFEFVHHGKKQPKQVRSHAMRESWRGRKLENIQRNTNKVASGARVLAPRPSGIKIGVGIALPAKALDSSPGIGAGEAYQEEGGKETEEEYDEIVSRHLGESVTSRQAEVELQNMPDSATGTLNSVGLAITLGSGILEAAITSIPYPINAQDREFIHHCKSSKHIS
jgi:hypothetical protein